MSGEKLDAYEALYAFEDSTEPNVSKDPFKLVNGLHESIGRESERETIPLLVSEGLRHALSVDSASETNKVLLNIEGGILEAEIVALLDKSPGVAYSDRKVIEASPLIGKAVQTTTKHYKMLLDEIVKRNPVMGVQLDQINAQFQFVDGIPKDALNVMMHEGVTREELKQVRYGLQ